jgi:dihydrofolate reductase
VGAVVGGRNTFEAAGGWGGHNPFGAPFFIVTHRPEDAPADAGFTFVNGLDEAIARAREAAGKRLFEGFDETVSLEHLRLLQSPFATHITYRVVR